jgi:thiamine biosynthesis lipoprotein
MQYSDSFRAMNTDVDVVVETGSTPIDVFVSLRLLFEEQEAKFSRFRPSSLLCRLNRGEAIEDPGFARVCALALEAHELTGGLYNPMVLPALVEAGYAGTFEEVCGGSPRPQLVPDPARCLEVSGCRVRLREGGLDLGGIVKGWTVDLGIELHRDRYPNLLINAGGDLRCEGAEEGAEGWWLTVDAPGDGPPSWQGAVHGALATSTTLKRRWPTSTGGCAHHLIDPRTGLPAVSPHEQVTVWAAETWRAEVWAKAVLIGGHEGAAACRRAGFRVLTLARGEF